MGSEPTVAVGHNIVAGNARWSFGGSTAQTFVEHAEMSIPGYRRGHEVVAALSDFFVHGDSRCWELGVSTGELLGTLARRHAHHPAIRWTGIDIEAEMTAVARKNLAGLDNVTIEQADLLEVDIGGADLVVSYYCLQFVPSKHRQRAVDAVYRGLNWGGAFIWFEKVRGPDARFQDMFTLLYNDYKVHQGFTADEILAKSRSLKGVLDPFSSEANRGILNRAGFSDIVTVYRDLCFEGVLAIR